jgi:hypothetical protein
LFGIVNDFWGFDVVFLTSGNPTCCCLVSCITAGLGESMPLLLAGAVVPYTRPSRIFKYFVLSATIAPGWFQHDFPTALPW